MFDISWTELMVIGVVALIAIGPKELPGVLRTVGQWAGKARRMAGEFQGQFREAMREAEMAELKKSFDEVKSATTAFTDNNPLTSLQKDVTAALSTTSPATTSLPAPAAAEQIAAETLAAVEAHAVQNAVMAPLAIVPEAAAIASTTATASEPAPTASNAAADPGGHDQAATGQAAKDQVKDQVKDQAKDPTAS
ncbi:Sec-independent protein translocase protein TatB [Rhodopseudomonas pseudopalustris]|uniref:Sec-independent protein translocase protein TatB n=1 Tax=Rhodopseudomonas pseudopalustris TaxID=1513892 RepID=UPI003F9D54F1